MSEARDALLERLAGELRPTPHWLRPTRLAAAWFALSWAWVAGVGLAGGPLRPGWSQQLLGSPQFAAESLVGFALGAIAIAGVFRLAVPAPGPARRWLPAALLLAAWVGALLYGLASPALEPSMVGKREGCWLQALLYGAAPLLLGLVLVRRLAPLARSLTGALVGLAAGALPALFMQLACLYDPSHALTHHLAPIAPLALLGAALGWLVLRRI